MGLFYTVIRRKVLAGEWKGRPMWFGQVKTSGRVSFEEVCEQAAHHSSATHGDIAGVVKEILVNVATILSEGNVANLGRVGNFRLSAGSRGADSPEEFQMHHMKRPRVVFSPGKALRKMIKGVGFTREKMKENIIPYEPCPEHP